MSTSHAVTAGGRERINRIVHDIYQDAFRDDPAFVYILDKLSDQQRYEFLAPYFTKLLTASGINGGIFEEVDDAGATVIMPPGKRVDAPFTTLLRAGMASFLFKPGVPAIYKMLVEFGAKSDEAKKKHLKGLKKYYYLFFIAVAPKHQGKGYANTLLKSLQARAAREGLPIWLEASSEKSMKVYTKNGFIAVDTMIMGKGKAGADGRRKKNGEGVTIWPMVWWPPKTESVSEAVPP